MSEKIPILEGDLVTVGLNEFQVASNTYVVLKKLPDACILFHPLAQECLILRQDNELNNTFPSMKSKIEQCLHFAKRRKENLGPSMVADLDALCFYFIIKKQFTPKQRHDLALICGKIAAVELGHNVAAATSMIKQNKVLLDEYNNSLLNSVKKIIDNPMGLQNKGERYTIFNIAGFILSQLHNS